MKSSERKATFEKDYFTGLSSYKKYSSNKAAFKRIRKWYMPLMAYLQQLGFIRPGLTALEVGMGHGAWLSLLKERGVTPYGSDISKYISEAVRDLNSFSVVVSDVQSGLPYRQVFDLVFAFEVMEHLDHVRAALANLFDVLRPGGYLVMTTPNPDCRIPFYDAWEDPTHVSVMSPENWREALASIGFRFVRMNFVFPVPLIHRFRLGYWKIGLPRTLGPKLLLVLSRPSM